MRTAILAGAAAALATALPAQADARGYRCHGYAEEQGADRVVGVAALDEDGLRQSLSISWAPVQKNNAPVQPGVAPDLELWVHYPAYSPEQLKVATGATLTLTTLASPAARGSSARLYRELANWRIDASFDGGEPIAVSESGDNAATDLPMIASRTALLAVPPTARIVQITLRDKRGRIVKTSSFDLTTARRDRLLPQAIAAAKRASADYRTCEETD